MNLKGNGNATVYERVNKQTARRTFGTEKSMKNCCMKEREEFHLITEYNKALDFNGGGRIEWKKIDKK
jgi:hypothetical protein